MERTTESVMRRVSGFWVAIGLCLVVLIGDASARGFGGARGGFGGYHGAYGGAGFDRYDGDRAAFRAGEYYGARRRVYVDGGFYSGGWGVDECDDSGNNGWDYDDGD
jgi:hypothetical protein